MQMKLYDIIVAGHQPPSFKLVNIIMKQITKSCQAKFTQHISHTI